MRMYVFVRVCACIRVLIQNRKSIVRSLVKICIAITRRFVFFYIQTTITLRVKIFLYNIDNFVAYYRIIYVLFKRRIYIESQ